MRSFTVDRGYDESGVSGTGTVIEGVEFENGRIVLHWLGEPGSIVLWDCFEDFWAINVASHPSNRTRVVFSDGEILSQTDVPFTRQFEVVGTANSVAVG